MQQQYKCAGCGAPLAFGARFCGNCGKQLHWQTQQQQQVPPKYLCAACNNPVTPDSHFCQNCGQALYWQDQQRAQPIPPDSKQYPPESRQELKARASKTPVIIILSLLLFLSLSFFGPAFLLNRTVLNPDLVASEVSKLEIASLIGDSISQKTPKEVPPAIGDSISRTVNKLEPQLKKELNTITYSIYDYLLGKRHNPDLASVLRSSLLSSNLIIPVIDEIDMTPLLKPIIKQQVAAWVPEELAGLTGYLDESIDTVLADQEPWIKQQVKTAADPIADYIVGKTNSLNVTIPVEPILDSLKTVLLNDFLESPPPLLAGLPPALIETGFNKLFNQFSQAIPKTFEIDETIIGKDVPSQVTASLAQMEESLSQVREYVRWFQIGYVLLIIFMVLLIVGIILIYRDMRGSTRALGIVFLAVGVIELVTLLLVKHLFIQQLEQATHDMPKQLQTWLPQLVNNMAAPLQILTIGLIVGGAVLLVMYFTYRPRPATR